jgi:molybdate transport system permease protein
MERSKPSEHFKSKSDLPFYLIMTVIGSVYIILIVAMILADIAFTSGSHLLAALKSEEIQYAIKLSLFSCTVTMILSVIVATPLGYALAKFDFSGKKLLDAIIDIPIILPPLVIGLSLLILFQTPPGRLLEEYIPITYAIPSIILAQFMVACAFAVRTMAVAFSRINERQEQVALTLGSNKGQAFLYVILPQAKEGLLTAASLSWARALGEFGPILIFSGATRMKTEVLSTTVFLEMSVGNVEAAVAVSMLMIVAGFLILMIIRFAGSSDKIKNERLL